MHAAHTIEGQSISSSVTTAENHHSQDDPQGEKFSIVDSTMVSSV